MTLASKLHEWADSWRTGPQPRGTAAAATNGGYTYEVRVDDEVVATYDNPEYAMTRFERLRAGGRLAIVRNVEPHP